MSRDSRAASPSCGRTPAAKSPSWSSSWPPRTAHWKYVQLRCHWSRSRWFEIRFSRTWLPLKLKPPTKPSVYSPRIHSETAERQRHSKPFAGFRASFPFQRSMWRVWQEWLWMVCSALSLNLPATPSSSLLCRREVCRLEHENKETQATQRWLFNLNNHFVIF